MVVQGCGGEKGGEEDEGNEELDSLEMTMPQLTGDTEAIKLLKSSESVKNLGIFDKLDGYSDRHMIQMKDRMEDWTI